MPAYPNANQRSSTHHVQIATVNPNATVGVNAVTNKRPVTYKIVEQTVTAIATVITVGSSPAPSTSSRILVLILTIVGVGVSLGHDDINLELYWSMC